MFREKLRYTREIKNISQIEMANKLGIAVTTYRNYENTSREPNFDILANISRVLEVSTDYLLGVEQSGKGSCEFEKKITQISPKSQKELDSYIDYLIYKESKE